MSQRPESKPGVWEILRTNPTPGGDKNLKNQRLRQWRPISRNPFEEPDLDTAQKGSSAPSNGPGVIRDTKEETVAPAEKGQGDSEGTAQIEPSRDAEARGLENPGPTWVNLFYDLAWTATFSSLTQNGEFRDLWDIVSYIAFFLIMWWMWVSQARFDVTVYIGHSPGLIGQLDPISANDIVDPVRFNAEKVARDSAKVISAAIALSRVILFVQYMRVLIYAYITARKRKICVPWKLWIMPVALLISIIFFASAWAVSTTAHGRTHSGAKLKFVFWSVGLLVEFFSHVRMSIGQSNQATNRPASGDAGLSELVQDGVVGTESRRLLTPQFKVTIRERLEVITTIILGEGINGIVGTLSAMISVPGLGSPIVSSLACSAIIVYFLAYFYFEGPTGDQTPKDKGRRQVYWVVLHLPLLLSIALLLEGVKEQFLLASFLVTSSTTFKGLNEAFDRGDFDPVDPNSMSNSRLRSFLIQRGISWTDEHEDLIQHMTQNGADPVINGTLNSRQGNELNAWYSRISLNITVKIYETLMGGPEKIHSDIREKIDYYLNDLTWPLVDYALESDPETESPTSMYYFQIIKELLQTNLHGARYITALAGLILIFLATLNLVHSRPQDRYQLGAIISRFVMGLILMTLLLLNIGYYQSLWVWDGQEKQQAGVFQWLEAYWVLPTIALAFATQFMVETSLLWLAMLRARDSRQDTSIPQLVWERIKFRKLE